MPTATGLVMIKKFNYRDDPDEEWSNKYWFTGSIPPDETAWTGLFNEVAALEAACFTANCRIVRAYGYNNSDDHSPAVWVHNLEEEGAPIPGTMPVPAGETLMAGDQAGLVQFKTNRRNARGKWIYLRKYYHDGAVLTSDSDTISPTSYNAYGQLALKMINGTLSGGRIIRSPGQDEVIQEAAASAWVTTRTLKRRGKRRTTVTP